MPYNPALDGVRALAVLAVIGFHCSRIVPGGFVGVDVFFVLSGFLITSILRDEIGRTGAVSLGRFYFRRALRLWPALLMMLAAYVALAPFAFPDTPAPRRDALLSGLYLSDYAFAFWSVPEDLDHTWSLSVEEHFYLLWPAAVLLLARCSERTALRLLLAAFVAATLWRFADLSIGGDFTRTYYRFDTRLSGLLLGGAVAVMKWRPGETTARALGITGLAAICFAFVALRWKHAEPLTFGVLLVDAGAACLILSLVVPARTALSEILAHPVAVYIGTISYSLYLWHFPIVKALRDRLDLLPLVGATLILSFAVAAASHHFIERPLRAWRHRFDRPRREQSKLWRTV